MCWISASFCWVCYQKGHVILAIAIASIFHSIKIRFLKVYEAFTSWSMIIHILLVTILPMPTAKSSFLCSGSQIEISIMKSVWDHQCERFLICDHDDLSNLGIENNFLKKIIFREDLSWKLASKKRLKEILKEIGKENEISKSFSSKSICLNPM